MCPYVILGTNTIWKKCTKETGQLGSESMGSDITLRASTPVSDTLLGEGEGVMRTWCILNRKEPENYNAGLGFKEKNESHVSGHIGKRTAKTRYKLGA